MDNTTTNAAKDPRCPVCGNAVLAGGIIGNEGTYHVECASPPFRIPCLPAYPHYPPPNQPWFVPGQPFIWCRNP